MRTTFNARMIAASLLLMIAACTSWEPYEVATAREGLPSTIRVTLTTGELQRLAHPSVRIVEGDTLISGRLYEGGPVWEASLRDVHRVEVGSVDRSASVLTGLGIVGGRRGMVQYLMSKHCEAHRCE
jgi:hypothetical protein